jgi:hypothetical protein
VQLKDIINKSLSKKLTAPFDVHTHMRTDQITSGLVHAISTVSFNFLLLLGFFSFMLRLDYFSAAKLGIRQPWLIVYGDFKQ